MGSLSTLGFGMMNGVNNGNFFFKGDIVGLEGQLD